MAGSLNKVTLIGNLGQDPEVQNFPNGGKIVKLKLATTERWRDRQTGERREGTEWHNVVIHAEALQKTAEQYLRRGSSVYVEGALETRKWQDQSGSDRYSVEVTLRAYRGELQMLDPHPDRGQGQRSSGSSRDGETRQHGADNQSQAAAGQSLSRPSADNRSQGTGPKRDGRAVDHGRGQPRDQDYQRQASGRGQQGGQTSGYSDNGPRADTSHQRNAY